MADLRIGVIGTGMMGCEHLRNLVAHGGADLLEEFGVAETAPARLQRPQQGQRERAVPVALLRQLAALGGCEQHVARCGHREAPGFLHLEVAPVGVVLEPAEILLLGLAGTLRRAADGIAGETPGITGQGP